MKTSHNLFLKLAFNIAKTNLGQTKQNPSVGCVVVKNNSVISSACTSINGRPHAEFNALSYKKNFSNSDLYLTMEPCTHKGLTPPCTNLIIKKGIKRVFFAFYDLDYRTARKSKKKLAPHKIKTIKKDSLGFNNFYQSYFLSKIASIPYIDAKIAISKDYYTINKKKKWITNELSRKRTHLLRSQYDSIISTSKSINKDNSLLNCRINGFNKQKPNLIIIDLKLQLRRNLVIFKSPIKRNILLITSFSSKKKVNFFKKKGVKILFINALTDKKDFMSLFKKLKKKGYNRILIETGLVFLKKILENKLIFNLFMFKSSNKLGKNGKNNISNNFLKKLNLTRKINVNLNNDKLYKIKIK